MTMFKMHDARAREAYRMVQESRVSTTIATPLRLGVGGLYCNYHAENERSGSRRVTCSLTATISVARHRKKSLRNGKNFSGSIVVEGGRFRLSGSAHDQRLAAPPAAPTPHGTAPLPLFRASSSKRTPLPSDYQISIV